MIKLHIRRGAIGALLLNLSACALTYGKQPHAGSPAAVVDAFEAAIAKGDEAAAALLAPGVLIYESGGQESSREEYVSHHMKSDMAFLAGSKREMLSRSEGGDDQHAWVATRSRIVARHQGKDVDLFSTGSVMLKRTPEGWRIVHIHWSSRPAAKAH